MTTLVLLCSAGLGWAQETRDFDGCLGVKVEGANYYNLVDPRCKTISSQYSSSPGEDARRERAEAAAKKKS